MVRFTKIALIILNFFLISVKKKFKIRIILFFICSLFCVVLPITRPVFVFFLKWILTSLTTTYYCIFYKFNSIFLIF
uniref:Uncharacterized protein n=1 Tax=Lotharella vacuolata TaxID=74820 RepID=A0A0H5BQX2_9EUKA|nr:hypothetical protein [Lotharella vacuolata]